MDRQLVLVIVCWTAATGTLLSSISRLANLDSYWETWVYRQQQKGIDPTSMKRTQAWDDREKWSSIVGVFLSLFGYVFPFISN